MNTEPTAPDDNGGPEVATTGELAASRCRGNDPACPCQDGDLCHYVDDPITGTKAMPAPDDLARTLAEHLVGIARRATAHNYGQTIWGYGFTDDGFTVHMSSWPRADEAVRAFEKAGYAAEHREDDGDWVLVRVPRSLVDHLAASVVSRRDADLRTRIEKVLGHCVHNGPCEVIPNGNCDALTDGTLLRSLLARALDADTREDAVNDQFAADLNDALHAASRVPADTDTGRGQ
jgi:hypothetical protein